MLMSVAILIDTELLRVKTGGLERGENGVQKRWRDSCFMYCFRKHLRDHASGASQICSEHCGPIEGKCYGDIRQTIMWVELRCPRMLKLPFTPFLIQVTGMGHHHDLYPDVCRPNPLKDPVFTRPHSYECDW